LDTLLAVQFLTTLPELSGALLGFLLQRFPPSPIWKPFPVPCPHAVGASGLPDFRAFVGEDPLEPRLLDPLLVFIPPRHSLSAPTAKLFRATAPSCTWTSPSPQGKRCLHFRVFSAPRTAFLSRGSVPSWTSRPYSLLRLFRQHEDPGIMVSPQPFPLHEGGFRRLWGIVRLTGV